MAARKLHVCTCPTCQGEEESRVKRQHEQMNLFMSTLNHQQRRWYAAVEADRVGHGGVAMVSRVTGLSYSVISRGRRELADAVEG